MSILSQNNSVITQQANISRAYWEPIQTSKMEHFTNIVYGFQSLTIFAKDLFDRILNIPVYIFIVNNKTKFSIFKRPTLRSEKISDNWKHCKNNEKCLFFHPESSFRSWDIHIFIQTFGLCRKPTWSAS